MKQLAMVVAVLLLSFPGSAAAKEAQTLDELVARFDSSRCRECHAEIYADWEQSLHAKPMLGPIGRTLATFQGYVNSRDTELKKSHEVAPGMREFLKPCVECHLPQMMDASEAVAVEIAEAIVDGDEEVLDKLQITCLVCHSRHPAQVPGRRPQGRGHLRAEARRPARRHHLPHRRAQRDDARHGVLRPVPPGPERAALRRAHVVHLHL